jgi:hypothetical protein
MYLGASEGVVGIVYILLKACECLPVLKDHADFVNSTRDSVVAILDELDYSGGLLPKRSGELEY